MSEEIALGHEAEALINNPAYKAALLMIKAELFDAFSRKTLWNGKKKREDIYKQMQAVDALESKIQNMMSNGRALEKQQSRADRVKNIKGI